jgi:hypothetical protein
MATRETLLFLARRSVCGMTDKKGIKQMSIRESDNFVVPVKAGNSAGGKEITYGRA